MIGSDDFEELALNRQLCFALYAASRVMTRAYRPMLQDLGLTYPQYLVLMVLWEWAQEDSANREKRNLGALGQRLLLDSGTLTPLLKRLEQRGLVQRQRATWDERVTLVAVTRAGLALKSRARKWVSQHPERTSIRPAEIEPLRDALWQFLRKIERGPDRADT
ncbi:MarR family winged helix-turn-helix transcriptional regulator [Microbulbifer sp. 2304DJ12-6]|uniref:MarR family winged helix-turn-helix transcriptional regulator n=1 Tax=Microbulbifer sp. 2304DJ12-6 TaxID=3233340 RepID=UPI0039AFAE5C